MARKRHSDEDILKLLREIEVTLANGSDVASACRSVGISDATYYNWRKRFGGMGRDQAHPDLSRVNLGERIQRTLQWNAAPRGAQSRMVHHNKAGSDRHQSVAQTVQPRATTSGLKHATASALNSNHKWH